MFKININKKILILLLAIFIIVVISYYIYTNNINYFINNEDVLINTEENNNTANNIENLEKKDNNILIVHISGAVQNEGVIELEEESRVINVIEKAGGLKENACIKDINLASKVEDGEKIYIPTQEEYENIENSNKADNNSKEKITIKNNENKNNVNKSSKININIATQSELETLPGIGTATAVKIITYRKENGKFKTIEDIKKVKGIGESKYNEIKDLIII